MPLRVVYRAPARTTVWRNGQKADRWADAIPECWAGGCENVAVFKLPGGELRCPLHYVVRANAGALLLARCELVALIADYHFVERRELDDANRTLGETRRTLGEARRRLARAQQSTLDAACRAEYAEQRLAHAWPPTRGLLGLQRWLERHWGWRRLSARLWGAWWWTT